MMFLYYVILIRISFKTLLVLSIPDSDISISSKYSTKPPINGNSNIDVWDNDDVDARKQTNFLPSLPK